MYFRCLLIFLGGIVSNIYIRILYSLIIDHYLNSSLTIMKSQISDSIMYYLDKMFTILSYLDK